MKKWLIIILVIAVISSASIYIYKKILFKIEIDTLESIVPRDAIYYFYSYNLNKKFNDFQKSQFFQQISSSVVYKKLARPKLDEVRRKIPFLPELTKRDTALAILSLSDIEPYRLKKIDIGDFLFLARLDPKKRFDIKKSLTDFYLLLAKKDKAASSRYRGISITSYRIPDLEMTIYYAILSDVLILSNKSSVIEESIDLARAENNHRTLLDNQDFLELKVKAREDSLLWGYINTKRYYEAMLQEFTYDTIKSRRTEELKLAESIWKMKPFVNLINIFQGSVFSLNYNNIKTGLVIVAYNKFDKSKDKENLLDVFVCGKEMDKDSLLLVPGEAIYYLGGSQDFIGAWKFLKYFLASSQKLMKAQIEKSPGSGYARGGEQLQDFSLEDSIQKLEEFLGVDIERDLISLLGENFGLVLVDFKNIEIPLSGLETVEIAGQVRNISLPLPEFFVLFELKDDKKMKDTLLELSGSVVDKINQFIQALESARKSYQNNAKQEKGEVQIDIDKEKKYLSFDTQEYRGENLYIIDLLEFPIEILKPNYCFLDKYIILSISPEITKRVISIYKDKAGSLRANFNFKLGLKNISFDNYSNIFFLNFRKIINILKSPGFADLIKQGHLTTTEADILIDDIVVEEALDILGNIHSYTFSNRVVKDGLVESQCFIEIEGL